MGEVLWEVESCKDLVELERLWQHLGYRRDAGVFRLSGTRRVIFRQSGHLLPKHHLELTHAPNQVIFFKPGPTCY